MHSIDTSLFFNCLLENSRISSILLLDKNGKILSISPGLEHSYGYTHADLLNKDFSLLFIDKDKLAKKPEVELQTVIKKGFSSDTNYIVHKDGSAIWSLGESVLVKDGAGEMFIIKIIMDINQEKLLEGFLETSAKSNEALEKKIGERTKELKKANTELSRINDDLNKYAYVISHDLKASLAAIEGLVPFIKQDYKIKPLDKEAEEMLDMITAKTADMRNIIEEVLRSAKREKKSREEINMYGMVNEIIQTLHPPSRFRILIQHSLPIVRFNKISLMQIIQNLLSNAIKFADKEQPLIEITSKEFPDYFMISIRDNGPGIPPELLEKIFHPFESFNQRSDVESHGIGLSIARQLVEENGGKIWAESETGKETVFHFTVPR